MADEVLLSVAEVASILKTNKDYVHKLRRSGLLPFIKIGNYKCLQSTLNKFLREQEGNDITEPAEPKPL